MENLNRKYEFSMNVEQLDSVFSTGAKFSTKDVKTGELHIQLTKSRSIINLNETLCYANILKPNGEVIAHECEVIDVEKGIVKLDLVTDAMNQPGLYNFEIVVTNSEEKLVTPTMQYQCYESLNDGDKIESSNEFGLLEKALIKVDLLRSEFEALYENLERNESTRVSNESIRTQNENQRQTNESNRVLYEQNRQTSFNKMVQDNNSYKDEIKNVINEFKEDINSDFDNYKKGINSDIFDDNKIDFFGKEHDSMKHRLNSDFDNLHQRINDSSLLPYEGTNIKADNTYYGLTKEATVKGRTLQNLFDYTKVVSCNGLICNNGIFSNNKVIWDYNFKVSDTILKPSTEYTVFIDYNKNTYTGNLDFRPNLTSVLLISPSYITMETSGVYRYKTTTSNEINLDNALIHLKGTDPNSVEGSFSFQIMILEGDHTNTPIEDLPFIEGIKSTGENEKTEDGRCKISGKSCGKNLFKDLDSFVNRFIQSEIGRGILEETGATTETAIRITMTKVIEIKPNTDYIITCKNSYGLSFTLAGEDMKVTSAVISWDNKYVLNNTNNYYLRLTFKRSDNANISPNEVKDMEIQVEEASTESSYEPYQESNYSYFLNEPLRSLPNGVADSIDLETGVLTRRVGKVMLNEKFTVGIDTANGVEDKNFIRGNIPFSRMKINGLLICDSVPYFNIHNLPGGSRKINFECICTHPVNRDINLVLKVEKIGGSTETAFLNYLKNNPMTVYYELAEPTTEQLTPTQLKSFEGTTHIISENKLMPIVSAKIPSDVNAVVQNLKAENVKLEKQLDSAIEELNSTDIDLIAMDWETDYRICELEWALLDTMKVETLAEGKAVESRILSRYEQAKILIKSGKYNKTTMEKQLTTYHNRRCLTDEEYNELMELMNH